MKQVIVLALVVSACSSTPGMQGEKGERGDVGPAGPQGLKGDPGTPPASMVWVDSTGALIGSQLLFTDSAGVQWPIDTDTGQVNLGAVNTLTSKLYLSSDCSGPAYVEAAGWIPRQPRGSANDATVYVRRDDDESEEVLPQSFMALNSCTPGAQPRMRVLAVADLVTHPRRVLLPVRGPLHVEFR